MRKRASESPTQAAEQAELTAAVALSTGMTLAQARAVKWSFRGINRPIGEVLDDGTITLRDLWWGLENAYDTRIRDAAKTILLTHLVGAEPKEPPPPLRVVVGSRFSERQERRSIVYVALLMGIAMMIGGGVLAFWLTSVALHWNWPWWVFLGILTLLVLLLGTRRVMERYIDQAEQYRLGRWGEEKVMDVLRYSLDSRWTLFQNFEWPNRKWGMWI